jgi:prepilin-type N-terminal cleavage/methylation domain-containing protein
MRMMKASRRGMTMVELMIVIAILGAMLALAMVGCGQCSGSAANKFEAEKEARSWAKNLGYDLVGIDCADIDTDRNGYVSCTANIKGQGRIPIECKGKYNFGHGCREQRLVFPNNATGTTMEGEQPAPAASAQP